MREAVHVYSCGGGATPTRRRGTLCARACVRVSGYEKKFVSSLFLYRIYFFNLVVYDSIIKKPGRRHVESDNIVFGRTVLQAPTNKS